MSFSVELRSEGQGPGLPRLPYLRSFATGEHTRQYSPRRVVVVGEDGFPVTRWLWVETFLFADEVGTASMPCVGSVSAPKFETPLAAILDAARHHEKHVHIGVLTAHRDVEREIRYHECAESWWRLMPEFEKVQRW